jgi:hypothetical protein
MRMCMRMDEFYDLILQMDDGVCIKSNLAILKARSEYFQSMFSSSH